MLGILSDTLTIQGNGSLETTADCGTSSNYGILCTGSITIGGSCKVTANGASGEVVTSEGISSMSSTITIKDDCTVNAAGGDIPYNSGSAYSKGIRGRRDVNIIGGRVKATGGKANDSRGIESNSSNISIDPDTNTLTLDNYKYEGAGRKESIYCGAIISDVGSQSRTSMISRRQRARRKQARRALIL